MHRFDLCANCSLSANQAIALFAGIAGISLAFAGVFVSMGYWPVLPFAGMELAVLGWALRASWRRGQDRERIIIDSSDITICRWRYEDETPTTTRLPREWTQVQIIERNDAARKPQLAFGRGGRWWVFGQFLVEQEKRALKRRIGQVLRQTSHVPVNDN